MGYHQLSKFRSDILPCGVDLGLVFLDSLGDRVGRFVTVHVISSSRPLPFGSLHVSASDILGNTSASTCMPSISGSQLRIASTEASLLFAITGAMLESLATNDVVESRWFELLLYRGPVTVVLPSLSPASRPVKHRLAGVEVAYRLRADWPLAWILNSCGGRGSPPPFSGVVRVGEGVQAVE